MRTGICEFDCEAVTNVAYMRWLAEMISSIRAIEPEAPSEREGAAGASACTTAALTFHSFWLPVEELISNVV